MGLFKRNKYESDDFAEISLSRDENRVRRIATLETARNLKQQEIEELLFELGKKSGKRSIYNKKRLKK